MLETYLRFVVERHRVWEARQLGLPGPWTDDPILRSRKFTNVFRVLDPGSQFVFELAESDTPSRRDVLARCLLYRLTNAVPAWRHAQSELGRMPLAEDIGPDLLMLWQDYRASGQTVFNPAYIVYPGHPGKPGVSGSDKLTTVFNRVNSFLRSERAERFLGAESLAQQYTAIVSHPDLGEFTAMQVSTDVNYTWAGLQDVDAEDTFIQAGPGAIRGARRVNPAVTPRVMIESLTDMWRQRDDVPRVEVRPGVTRLPSLMDIQNTLCEFSKYARYLDRDDSTGRADYRLTHPGPQEEPTYPTHW